MFAAGLAVPLDMGPLYAGMSEFRLQLPGNDFMLPVVVAVMHGPHGVGVYADKNNVTVFPQNLGRDFPYFRCSTKT